MAKQSFETALKSLENIVGELENTELPLEEALKKFEKGIKLSSQCSQKLEEIEEKITILMKNNKGAIEEKQFTPLDHNIESHND